MKQEENSEVREFLLAAAALALITEPGDNASIRDALQKALHSDPLKDRIRMNPGMGKKLANFLSHFSDRGIDERLKGLFFALPEELGKFDTEICRLLANKFIFGSDESNQLEKYLDAVSEFVEQPAIIINWFWKLVYVETFRLALEVFAASDLSEIAEDDDWRQRVNGQLAATQYDEQSLPRKMAATVAKSILQERDSLDESIDRFLMSSHMPSPDTVERAWLRLALFLATAETINPVAVKEAISVVCPAQMNGRLKKFARNGLTKAVNSRNRELAFQILYAFSFNWPENREVLTHEYFLSSSAVVPEADIISHKPQGMVWQMVSGVWQKKNELDNTIAKYSHKWRVERLGRIELLLLRMGLFEIESGLIPARIVISEILELADKFGVPDAKSLVNGILDAAIKGMPDRQNEF